jgi:hypothetical protein
MRARRYLVPCKEQARQSTKQSTMNQTEFQIIEQQLVRESTARAGFGDHTTIALP